MRAVLRDKLHGAIGQLIPIGAAQAVAIAKKWGAPRAGGGLAYGTVSIFLSIGCFLRFSFVDRVPNRANVGSTRRPVGGLEPTALAISIMIFSILFQDASHSHGSEFSRSTFHLP